MKNSKIIKKIIEVEYEVTILDSKMNLVIYYKDDNIPEFIDEYTLQTYLEVNTVFIEMKNNKLDFYKQVQDFTLEIIISVDKKHFEEIIEYKENKIICDKNKNKIIEKLVSNY